MARDLSQRPGQIRIAEDLSCARSAARRQEDAGRICVPPQFSLAGDPVAGKDFSHGKAFFRVADGGGQQVGEFPPPEPLHQFGPAIHRSGNRDGMNVGLRHL